MSMIITIEGDVFGMEAADAMVGHPRAAYVSLYDKEFYSKCLCLLSHRGGEVRAGCAITPEGELITVFRTSYGKSFDVDQVISHALDTGRVRYLECYDGKLPQLYRKYGFVEEARFPFDKTLAAPTWNYERDGSPDYLRLVHVKSHVTAAFRDAHMKGLI